MYVRPKKSLGQHFLRDEDIAHRIVNSLEIPEDSSVDVIEVGPGTGVLTRYLILNKRINLTLAEIDSESVDYLREQYPRLKENMRQEVCVQDGRMPQKMDAPSDERMMRQEVDAPSDERMMRQEVDAPSDERMMRQEVDAPSDERMQQEMDAPSEVVVQQEVQDELPGFRLLHGDFLKMELSSMFSGDFFVIGNFPYNISSQIFFKILDYKDSVPQAVGMLQKEVAERLASPPGKKSYGILSVLLQAWYNIEYLFTVQEDSFIPPPKVKSAVIRLKRNDRESLGCDEQLFKKVIKATFNQRRKTIRNSLKPLLALGKRAADTSNETYSSNVAVNDNNINQFQYLLDKRPEQLSVEEFIQLTLYVESII